MVKFKVKDISSFLNTWDREIYDLNTVLKTPSYIYILYIYTLVYFTLSLLMKCRQETVFEWMI